MTDVDTVELKPCPFCGSSAEILTSTFYGRLYTVSCTGDVSNDQCLGAHSEQDEQGGFTAEYDAIEDAVEAWNTRTIAALPPAVPATTPDPAESHVDGWRVRVIEWATDETVKVVQCKGEREAKKIERGMGINMASEYYTEIDNKPRTTTTTTTPDPVAEAAKVLLADDDVTRTMSEAWRVADDLWLKNGEITEEWDRYCVRAALLALTKDGEAG